jgi:hypothetical protein
VAAVVDDEDAERLREYRYLGPPVGDIAGVSVDEDEVRLPDSPWTS